MRGLRDTAEVTKIVVTVALMLGMLALAQWIWNPTKARNDVPFFGQRLVQDPGRQRDRPRAHRLGAAVAIAVGLRSSSTGPAPA